MKQRILSFLILLGLIAMLIAPLFMTGCAQLQKAANDADKIVQPTTQAVGAVIEAAKHVDINSPALDVGASAIPYGALALALARLIFVEIDRNKKNKQLKRSPTI